jgi:glycosyltransferase involved in cell wall biosynthesis
MKIAVAKPNFGALGGFEGVVSRLVQGLRDRGHTVEHAEVDATGSPTSHLTAAVNDLQLKMFNDFFRHLNLITRFEALDLAAYDVVLCAQPASYAVRHPRKVVLFYHHIRTYYDLQHLMEQMRGHDADLYRLATAIIRDVDSFFLTRHVPILAGSARVKERLAEQNGLYENVEVFSAGIDEAFLNCDQPSTFGSPLAVGRHEFPKRTELFVHAMQHVNGIEGRIVGEGEFTERLKAMDAWLRLQHLGAGRSAGVCVDDDRLWRQHMIHLPLEELRAAQEAVALQGVTSTIRFLGRLDLAGLVREYASAMCVVCPAFDEDYGLTCLEAMACGKPVIACRDGGGYVELIDDGVDGFLVEPTGRAIAGAIERLRDVTLARTMGERGRRKAQAYTWTRAIDQVERALERARSRPANMVG